MATIKVFSAGGVKVLNCFDTADEVEYLSPDQILVSEDPFEDFTDLEPE